MSNRIGLEEFVELYAWESETQKKGFQALVKDLRDTAVLGESSMEPIDRIETVLMRVCCWMIQKDHESNEWYNQRFGDLDKRVRDDLVALMKENRALRSDVEELKAAVLKR